MRRSLHMVEGRPAPRNHATNRASQDTFVSVLVGHRHHRVVKSTVICDPKPRQESLTDTDRKVPFNMALQALAHPDFSDDDVCLVWGTDNVRVRTLREIKDLGYLCLREFGLKYEDTVRGEDPRSAFGAFGGALG